MPLAQKSAIAFALVYIPVDLHVATRHNRISFNQLCKKTKARVRYKKVDESTGAEVGPEDIVKAYQYDKDTYIEVSDEDFESLKTEKDKTIQIVKFTDLETIPLVYFDKAYHVVPQKGGEKAYELLRRVMYDKGKVAIGKTVVGNTETTMALVPTTDGILLHTLYFGDEVRDLPKDIPQPEVSPMEMEMAARLLATMAGDFDPFEFKNEYLQRLNGFLSTKLVGKKVTV
ncbi:MAG: Ku protein, partial [Planctomycetes bacterium]|nr:Ku protein [Planctomycetota bacterium]